MKKVDGFEYVGEDKTDTVSSPLSEENHDKYGLEKQKTRRFSEDTDHRSGLITWVKWVVSLWLLCTITVVAFNSILHLDLKEGVLIVLLTTTTVNILGLAYIVLQGLFKANE